jgi:hypothetical protein
MYTSLRFLEEVPMDKLRVVEDRPEPMRVLLFLLRHR